MALGFPPETMYPYAVLVGRHDRRAQFQPGRRAIGGRIAQLVEQLTLNQRVVGSNPTAPTM